MTRLGQTSVQAAFSPDAALFAVVGTSNIRVFDTGNRRLVTTLSTGAASANDSQAFQQFTSLSWGHHAAQVDGSSGGRTLAVGTATGSVLAFDVSLGELLWEATTGLEGGVTALAAASSSHGGFIATGAGGCVVYLQPASGTVQASWQGGRYSVTAMAASESGRLVLGSATVSIWDAANKKRLFKFSGHATSATAVASTEDGRYAVSAAAGERAVAVWDASGKPRSKVRTAAASLPMEASAVAVEVCSAGGVSGDQSMLIAALTEHGDAFVWRCTHNAEQGTEQSPSTSLRWQQVLHIRAREQGTKSTEISAASIQAVKLDVGSDGSARLLLARGAAKPLFERLTVPLLGEELAQVTLEPMQGGVLLSQDAVPSGRKPPVAGATARGHSLMLGAENDGAAVAQRPLTVPKAVPMEGVGSAKRRRAAESESARVDAGTAGDEAGTADDDAMTSNGGTFGERVAALRVAEVPAPLPDMSQQGADGSITADSLSVLLSQALRSGDRSLLERCLNISNPRVIENTVRRLAASDAAVFLQAVVSRLQSKPARGQELQHWIRAVLLQHTAYLMSAPGAQAALSALYQSVQARRATHEPLLALSGRLELVRAQLDKATNDVHMHIKPQVVFHDDDGDDEITAISIGGESESSDSSDGESD